MPDTLGRNIVILCDGMGNGISENISNVLKLYRCLRKTAKTQPRQLVQYDPGVGTLAQPSNLVPRSKLDFLDRNNSPRAPQLNHSSTPPSSTLPPPRSPQAASALRS